MRSTHYVVVTKEDLMVAPRSGVYTHVCALCPSLVVLPGRPSAQKGIRDMLRIRRRAVKGTGTEDTEPGKDAATIVLDTATEIGDSQSCSIGGSFEMPQGLHLNGSLIIRYEYEVEANEWMDG